MLSSGFIHLFDFDESEVSPVERGSGLEQESLHVEGGRNININGHCQYCGKGPGTAWTYKRESCWVLCLRVDSTNTHKHKLKLG